MTQQQTQNRQDDPQPPLVDMRAVSKAFGSVCALEAVDLQVSRGEILGVLGANGAGKTTAMRLLTGFLPADAGTIRLCGYDIAKEPLAAKRMFGYLPEGMPLWQDMRVDRFLRTIADLRRLYGVQRSARIDSVVGSLGLSPVLARRIETLSKGYKRRVGLAQALLHDPEVLIFDEPMDGLDPNQKHELKKLINSMKASKAILISTHVLEEVESLCDRVVILHEGRIVAEGTPQGLAAHAPKGEGSALQRAFRAYTSEGGSHPR